MKSLKPSPKILLALPLFALTMLGAADAAKSAAPAVPTVRKVPYTQDTTSMEGRWVYPATSKTRLPMVVLFPDWIGMSPTPI